MTLADLEAKGWLYRDNISRQEVLDLLHEAESDLRDARRDLLAEWNFSLACTAASNLCTLLLLSSGYRVAEHFRHKVFYALPLILGEARKADAEYLESCLQTRHHYNTQKTQTVTPQQVAELTRFTEDLYSQVLDWLSIRDSALVVNSDVSFSQGSDWVLSLIGT